MNRRLKMMPLVFSFVCQRDIGWGAPGFSLGSCVFEEGAEADPVPLPDPTRFAPVEDGQFALPVFEATFVDDGARFSRVEATFGCDGQAGTWAHYPARIAFDDGATGEADAEFAWLDNGDLVRHRIGGIEFPLTRHDIDAAPT